MQALPKPIVSYLGKLEIALKQKVGVSPEDALSDAREHLCREYTEFLESHSEAQFGDGEAMEHLTATYGDPQVIADQYEAAAKPNRMKIPGYAPGWRICCTHCGRSAPAAKVGVTQAAAYSLYKVTVGWCHDCGWFRWFRLVKDLDQVTLTHKLSLTKQSSRVKRRHRPWLMLAILLLTIGAAVIVPVSAAQFGFFRATSQEKKFESLPPGWKLTSSKKLPKKQVAGIGKKFGFAVDSISNNQIDDGKGSVQINAIHCPTAEDAKKAYDSFQELHKNGRECILNDKMVFEFSRLTGDWRRLFAEARYKLSLQPEAMTYHVKFDAVPLAEGDPMKWNNLFNMFLQRESVATAALDKEIQVMAKSFQVGDQLTLKRLTKEERHASWVIKPSPHSTESTCGGDAQIYRLKGVLPTKANFPYVSVSGKVQSATKSGPKTDRRHDAELLKATKHWPVDDPEIRKLASEITANATSDADKVQSILAWFLDERNIRVGGEITGSRYGVEKVLSQKFGHCCDYADVFVTLCRAADVPSRQLWGWLYGVSGHVWCEVILDGSWQQFDPTTGTHCGSDYIPIVITEEGTMPFVYASQVRIDVID